MIATAATTTMMSRRGAGSCAQSLVGIGFGEPTRSGPGRDSGGARDSIVGACSPAGESGSPSSLIGIVVGIVLAVAILSGVSADATAIVEATIVFWIVHIIVMFFALRVFVRDPSVSLAMLLALASTIVSLIIVNIIVSGVSVDGVGNYLLAGIIIWICTAIADVIGGRMIRERRRG